MKPRWLVIVMGLVILTGLATIVWSVPYVTRYPEAISTAGMGAGFVAMGVGALWTLWRYRDDG
jgi:hypothetical protein